MGRRLGLAGGLLGLVGGLGGVACGGGQQVTGPTQEPQAQQPAAPPTTLNLPVGADSGRFKVETSDGAKVPKEASGLAAQTWAEVTACAGLNTRVDGLPFVLHPTVILPDGAACIEQPKGCFGGYYEHLGHEVHVIGDPAWSFSWKHEELHLLLDLATGDGDVEHKSPLFGQCTNK